MHKALAVAIFGLLTVTAVSAENQTEQNVELCEQGIPRACLSAGHSMSFGLNGSQRDLAAAAECYERACKMGEGIACSYLGSMYDQGKGVPHHHGNALSFYAKGCELGDPNGCYRLGEDALRQRRPGYIRLARDFFGLACDRGMTRGCSRYRKLLAESRDKSELPQRPGATPAHKTSKVFAKAADGKTAAVIAE